EGRTRALDGPLWERQNLLYGSRSRRKSHGNARLRHDFCARRGVGRERYREVSSTPARRPRSLPSPNSRRISGSPNPLEWHRPDIPILKQAKAEYAKLKGQRGQAGEIKGEQMEPRAGLEPAACRLTTEKPNQRTTGCYQIVFSAFHCCV